MKTNQMMQVRLGNYGVVAIGHKTRMGSANEIMKIGNDIRQGKGLAPKTLDSFLRRKDTWEKVIKLHNESVRGIPQTLLGGQSVSPIGEELNGGQSNGTIVQTLLYETLSHLPYDKHGKIKHAEVLKTGYFNALVKTQTRGKLSNRGTWFELVLLLDLATWLDVDLWYEVYSTFIDGKLLELRDDGGNSFKLLNKAIDRLDDRSVLLKPKGNRGCYIQAAKVLRGKLKVLDSKGYNKEDHDKAVQKMRDAIQSKMVSFVDVGFVTTWNEFKITLAKV